jgi:hypothetical protein
MMRRVQQEVFQISMESVPKSKNKKKLQTSVGKIEVREDPILVNQSVSFGIN